MIPIQQKISSHYEGNRLHPKRQLRQWSMAVLIELDQGIGAMDVEYQRRANNQKTDTQETRHQRNKEPIA